MGKVLWHITMSLDGFIAGPGDDMAWLADYLGPNPTAEEVLAQIGALLIGNRTYHGTAMCGTGPARPPDRQIRRRAGVSWLAPPKLV